jgi:hypothetical protein
MFNLYFVSGCIEFRIHYQRLINIKKAIYQVVTVFESLFSLITLFFVNNPNSLGCKAFVFLRVKQNYFNEFTS